MRFTAPGAGRDAVACSGELWRPCRAARARVRFRVLEGLADDKVSVTEPIRPWATPRSVGTPGTSKRGVALSPVNLEGRYAGTISLAPDLDYVSGGRSQQKGSRSRRYDDAVFPTVGIVEGPTVWT